MDILSYLDSLTLTQYLHLLVRILGTLGAGVAGLVAFSLSAINLFKIIWAAAVKHMAESLSQQFVSQASYEAYIKKLDEYCAISARSIKRLDEGAATMNSLSARISALEDQHHTVGGPA